MVTPVVVAGQQYTATVVTASAPGKLQLTFTATSAAGPIPPVAYFGGAINGSWNSLNSSSGTFNTNWLTTATGGVDTQQVPGAATNVFISANGASNLNAITLDSTPTINSLNLTSTGTANSAGSTISVGSGTNLTINALALNGNTAGNGITVNAGAGTSTITAPVVLNGSQTWTSNNAANTLSLSGGISDATGTSALTIVGPGTIGLGSSNSFPTALNIGTGATAGSVSITGGGGLGGNALVNLGGTTSAGTLIYTGLGETIAKTITLSGTTGSGVLDQSGSSGLVKYSNFAVSGNCRAYAHDSRLDGGHRRIERGVDRQSDDAGRYHHRFGRSRQQCQYHHVDLRRGNGERYANLWRQYPSPTPPLVRSPEMW